MDDRQRPQKRLLKVALLVSLLALAALAGLGPTIGGLIAFLAGLGLSIAFIRKRHDVTSPQLLIVVGVTVIGGAAFVSSSFRSTASLLRTSNDLPALGEVCRAPKPTLVIFSAEWCGYCKALKEKTLTDPEVKKRLEKYAVEFVDVDQNKALARKAKISGVPSLFVLSPQCKTVDSLGGYAGPEDFLKWLDQAEKHL